MPAFKGFPVTKGLTARSGLILKPGPLSETATVTYPSRKSSVM